MRPAQPWGGGGVDETESGERGKAVRLQHPHVRQVGGRELGERSVVT